MSFRHFLLILGLAPLPAAAFGDMDCVVSDRFDASTCTMTRDIFEVTFDWTAFEVTFDWTAQTASIIQATRTRTLPRVHKPAARDTNTAVLIDGTPIAKSTFAACERKQVL